MTADNMYFIKIYIYMSFVIQDVHGGQLNEASGCISATVRLRDSGKKILMGKMCKRKGWKLF